MEYIGYQTEFLPPPIFHILSAQTILLYTQMQCSFVSHTHTPLYENNFLKADQVNGDYSEMS